MTRIISKPLASIYANQPVHFTIPVPIPVLVPQYMPPPISLRMPYTRITDMVPPNHTLVNIPFQQTQYILSSSLLSRSRVMQRLIEEAPSNTITLNLSIHSETFHIILGHLSRPLSQEDIAFFAQEKPHTALNLLAACDYLELEPLYAALMSEINTNLNRERVEVYTDIMSQYRRPRKWIRTLEHHILLYLVTCLPIQLNAFQKGNTGGYEDLRKVYARLPRHLMTQCLQHRKLPVHSLIKRMCFAKRVLSSHPDLQAIIRYDRVVVVKKTLLRSGRLIPKE